MPAPAVMHLINKRRIRSSDDIAVVGGRMYSRLADVTSDPAALDSRGRWVAVLPFDGPPTFVRFEHVEPARPWKGRPWVGPRRDAWESSLDQEAFEAGVRAVRDGIAAGNVYQVNLCRVVSAPLPADSDLAALGGRLSQGNPAPFAAVVRMPSLGLSLASASPELFLARRGAHVESRPIKGTAATVDGFTAKDRAENVMIVDLVRNDLGRVCESGSVRVPALCAPEPHPGLHHLVSTVRGRLSQGAGWPELIAATFPPGSVTGAPKEAALSFIRALEPVGRGPYCGAVGWVDADRRVGELNVAIRTFWASEGRLRFGTGAGITWGSTPRGEWAETELKAHRLLSLASCPS